MNTLNKIAAAALTAVVLLSTNAAFAAEKTRAEVVAELAQARASGALAAMNSDDPDHFMKAPRATTAVAASPAPVGTSTPAVAGAKTRAQVIAELRASQADGTLALMHSEDPTDQARAAQILQNKAAAPAMAE